MPLRTYIVGLVVLLGAATALCSQSGAYPSHVTEQDIVNAMREKGIVIAPAQVKMLTTIPVREQHPLLEAVKMEAIYSDTYRVLLRCADRSACIPFYVALNGLGSDQQVRLSVPGKRTSFSQSLEPGVPVMKRGSTATLEIVARDMLITVPVVCLQSGRQGEQVKVSLIDHSRTYQAEIVSSGLLRSRM
jgi:hypothetical protein